MTTSSEAESEGSSNAGAIAAGILIPLAVLLVGIVSAVLVLGFAAVVVLGVGVGGIAFFKTGAFKNIQTRKVKPNTIESKSTLNQSDANLITNNQVLKQKISFFESETDADRNFHKKPKPQTKKKFTKDVADVHLDTKVSNSSLPEIKSF